MQTIIPPSEVRVPPLSARVEKRDDFASLGGGDFSFIAFKVVRRREALAFGKVNRAHDRWLQRTVGRVGEHLGRLRDRVLDATALQRHSLVLDLHAGTGLLTREALRRVPEGGVWALTDDRRAALLQQEVVPRQAQRLSALEAIYHTPDDALVNWGLPELQAALLAAGFSIQGTLRYETQEDERRITAAHLARWFAVSPEGARPSHASHLLACLSPVLHGA